MMRRSHHRLIVSGRKTLTPLFLLLIPLLTLTLILIPAPKPSRSSSRSNLKPPRPPRLAYLISGSNGDGERIKRVLRAVYHPLNLYLVGLDLGSGSEERADLERFVGSGTVFRAFGNVRVLEEADLVTNKGPTAVAMVLHAVAILLKEGKEWSWFVNLSASDYPLVPQDDLLHVFSYLPRDLNFIEHTSNMGWKENERARPMIVDPSLYVSHKADMFWVKEKRSMPASFKLFVGTTFRLDQFPHVCLLHLYCVSPLLMMGAVHMVLDTNTYKHSAYFLILDFPAVDVRFLGKGTVVWM